MQVSFPEQLKLIGVLFLENITLQELDNVMDVFLKEGQNREGSELCRINLQALLKI